MVFDAGSWKHIGECVLPAFLRAGEAPALRLAGEKQVQRLIFRHRFYLLSEVLIQTQLKWGGEMAKNSSLANVTDPISAMLKVKTGLAYLQNSEPLKLLFAPDAIRDATINIDDREVFANEVLGSKSKNRTSAHAQLRAR